MDTIKIRKMLRIAFVIYIIAVISLTFIVRETMVLRLPDSRGVILAPFRDVQAMIECPNHKFWFMQIFLNVLFFVPLGFLLPFMNKRFNDPVIVTVTGFLFSFGIESMQFITSRGVTEIDDIINNTLGAFIGFVAYTVFLALFPQLRELSQKQHS